MDNEGTIERLSEGIRELEEELEYHKNEKAALKNFKIGGDLLLKGPLHSVIINISSDDLKDGVVDKKLAETQNRINEIQDKLEKVHLAIT